MHALKFTGRVLLVLEIRTPERELLDNFTLCTCTHARDTDYRKHRKSDQLCKYLYTSLPLSVSHCPASLSRSLAPSLPRSLAPSISSTARMCVCRGDMELFEIWGSIRKTKSSLGALQLPLFLRYVNDTEREFQRETSFDGSFCTWMRIHACLRR